jgi:hypothetical protein
LHALPSNFPANLDQILNTAQSWVAACDLDICPGTKVVFDHLDPLDQQRQGHVMGHFGLIRKIAQRTIEIAALGDFKRNAGGWEKPSCHLIGTVNACAL